MKIRFDIQDEAAFKVIKEINDLDFDSIYSSIVSSVLENLFKDFDKPSHVQSINVIFKVMDGIAYTTPLLDSSKTIYFSTTYLKDIYIKDGFDRFYNELCGVLLHETYSGKSTSSAPSWIIEGIADYIRLIEQLNPPHWKKRRTIDWKGGYEDTSYFLDFIEKNITPGIVVWINQKLFDEDYADEFFLEATGTSIFQLWELYQDTIPQEEESPEFSFETHKIDLERIKFKLIDTIPDSYGSILYNSIILNTPDFLKAQSSKIISLLYTDKCYPSYITSITLAIKDMDGVAHCENLTHSTRMISLSTNYIEKFFFSNKANQNLLADEIFGVVVHELTHAWQWATKLNAPTDNSKAPFGVIEGVADFVRLNSGYIPKHWNEEKSKSKTWDAGYETSGYFFYWIETRRPGFIVSMNEKVGRFGWRDELIKEICGRSADALWREYIGRKEIDEQEAVQLLNSLQTNAAILEVLRKSSNSEYPKSIPEMINYWSRCGYSIEDLDKLSIIHIAGTKGKGSTSAFCESILQRHYKNGTALKTGLYTSPHLMEVRERIRINGKPLSKEDFSKYFFEVWDKLEDTSSSSIKSSRTGSDKPGYFRYLTLMSFHVFIQEKVDVAVVEVGVGGSFDATNIINRPTVTGVTSLGLDHVAILGKTVSEIAVHKTGIFKIGAPAYSVVHDDAEANKVVEKRAQDLGCSSLTFVTSNDISSSQKLGLPGAHQRLNAALAVKICSEFILADPLITENPAAFEEGLEKVAWPGRAQKFISPDPNKPKISWFLDGAHTAESVAVASDWIKNDIKPTGKMTLLFNCTGGRNNYDLLAPLYKVHAELGGLFSSVIFTTNETYKTGYAPDLTNNNLTHDFTGQEQLKKVWNEIGGESSLVVESIEEAVEISFSKGVDVVVTGSLHLIGGVLQVLKADVV